MSSRTWKRAWDPYLSHSNSLILLQNVYYRHWDSHSTFLTISSDWKRECGMEFAPVLSPGIHPLMMIPSSSHSSLYAFCVSRSLLPGTLFGIESIISLSVLRKHTHTLWRPRLLRYTPHTTSLYPWSKWRTAVAPQASQASHPSDTQVGASESATLDSTAVWTTCSAWFSVSRSSFAGIFCPRRSQSRKRIECLLMSAVSGVWLS